ncbi:hypothetical protein ACSSS7_005829 [Eimeria intestinalis]
MAFFGVDSNLINCGTPSASQKSESCDMTPYQAVLVSREVRMRGVTAAQQTYGQLQYEYGQAYAAYQQLQADVQQKSVAVEKYLGGLDAATRLVCEKAALAKISQVQEGGTEYTHPKYAALTSGAVQCSSRTKRDLQRKILFSRLNGISRIVAYTVNSSLIPERGGCQAGTS